MAEVTITINGRHYDISCDNGQEGRVVELAAYIDQKLQSISRAGGVYNDAHLLVLTSMLLADELFDAREGLAAAPDGQQVDSEAAAQAVARAKEEAARAKEEAAARTREEEETIVKILDHLTKRIDGIAARVQSA